MDEPLARKNEATGHTDEPLARVSEEDEALGISAVAHDVAPEDFDFSAFVAGARPGRRAVLINARGDLIAEMETLLLRAEEAERRGEPVDDIADEYEQLKASYEAASKLVIVEARSTEWLRNLQKTAKKQHGLDPRKSEDAITINLRQIAGQIVHPKTGVTVEALRQLYEASEVEIDKLYRACRSANSNAGVVPDFSRRRSAISQTG